MKISRELIGVRLLFSLSNKGTAIAKSSPLLPKLMKYKWATVINHSQTHIFFLYKLIHYYKPTN